MPRSELGSLTKEFRLQDIIQTLSMIRKSMLYKDLHSVAGEHTNVHIPGIIAKRFLVVDGKRIRFDKLLSLVQLESNSDRVKKTLYLVWAMRDIRIRRFILEIICKNTHKWNLSELRKIANKDFFEQFGFSPASSMKARSNFENFVSEVDIVDNESNIINFNLESGWLYEAVQIAAQNEKDHRKKQLMIKEPIRFLVNNNLQGLVNATKEELLDLDNPDIENGEIDLSPGESTLGDDNEWNREPPQPRTLGEINPNLNNIDLERACRSHFELEKLFNTILRSKTIIPYWNKHIDLKFSINDHDIIVEIKSATLDNFHSQIRKALSQILEYAFLYQDRLLGNLIQIIMIEIPPDDPLRWLITFLNQYGIILVWREGKRIVSSADNIPRLLSNIIHQAEE